MQIELSIQSMSVDEFAGIQKALGEKIIKTGAVYWRRVRPRFFRPLLPYKAYEGDGVVAPCRRLGGFQHVAASEEKANSTMNFLMLDEVHTYSLDSLRHERRYLIKKASEQFEVRPILDAGELRTQGYEAYLSFYKRTGYSYRADRVRAGKFADWADTVLRFPKACLWGGFGKSGLVAVSIAYWVEQTVVYSTFFCRTEFLRAGVGELMFHKLRETVAQLPGVHEIFVRPYQGGNGMDKYYMLRGCKIVRKPAILDISSIARLVLKSCLPRQYDMLCGRY